MKRRRRGVENIGKLNRRKTKSKIVPIEYDRV